jgi:DNA-damage-inducible protein J
MNDAPLELRITLHGHVVVEGGGQSALVARFAEHEAAGLVAAGVPDGAARSVGFWRGVAADFLRTLCHLPEGVEFSLAEIGTRPLTTSSATRSMVISGKPRPPRLARRASARSKICRFLSRFIPKALQMDSNRQHSDMKSASAKLQIRIDRDLKEAAEGVFNEIGLDATTAVRLFFTKVAQTRSIPFRLKAEPEFTPEAEARILAAWEESKDPANRLGPYTDVEEMFRDLHAEIASKP